MAPYYPFPEVQQKMGSKTFTKPVVGQIENKNFAVLPLDFFLVCPVCVWKNGSSQIHALSTYVVRHGSKCEYYGEYTEYLNAEKMEVSGEGYDLYSDEVSAFVNNCVNLLT